MTFSDRITAFLIGISIPIILIMSGANVAATLKNTGEPAFIEGYTIYFLSCLAPVTSIALKLATRFFTTTQGKNRYEQSLFAVTAISFVLWVALYALEYGNSSHAGDLLSFDVEEESVSYAGWLAFQQLFLEVVVGAILMTSLTNILAKTEGESYRINKAWEQAKKALDEHVASKESLTKARNQVLLQSTKYEEGRKTYINEAVAQYLQLKERIDSVGELS